MACPDMLSKCLSNSQFWVLGSVNDFDLCPIVERSSKKQEEWNTTYKKNSPSIYQITLNLEKYKMSLFVLLLVEVFYCDGRLSFI